MMQEGHLFVRRDARGFLNGLLPLGEHPAECEDFDLADLGDETRDWLRSEGFPEVPASMLVRKKWRVLCYGKWRDPEDILIGEARGLCYAVERSARCRPTHDVRLLLLVDNMSICLSFARARCRHFKVLVLIRRVNADAFARNMRFSCRWIPSELNSSDRPS